jgi:hypothetical protein
MQLRVLEHRGDEYPEFGGMREVSRSIRQIPRGQDHGANISGLCALSLSPRLALRRAGRHLVQVSAKPMVRSAMLRMSEHVLAQTASDGRREARQ